MYGGRGEGRKVCRNDSPILYLKRLIKRESDDG